MKNKNIWIIGASSGIGEALAIELDKENANLILSARSKDALNQLNQDLEGKHLVIPIDLSDKDSIDIALKEISDKNIQINQVINLAAIYSSTKMLDLPLEKIEAIIDVNLTGTFRLVHKLVPFLTKQDNNPELIICGSVAGYFGLPNAQPYSSTKAGIINLCQSLVHDLKDTNIKVKIINPGFVKTEMTDQNDFEMPAIITPDIAALEIIKGLKSNNFEIHFPKKFTFVMKFLQLLPQSIREFLVRKLV